MTKGSRPVAWNGKIHGHDVWVEGRGWVYRPLPKPIEWIVLDESPSEGPSSSGGER